MNREEEKKRRRNFRRLLTPATLFLLAVLPACRRDAEFSPFDNTEEVRKFHRSWNRKVRRAQREKRDGLVRLRKLLRRLEPRTDSKTFTATLEKIRKLSPEIAGRLSKDAPEALRREIAGAGEELAKIRALMKEPDFFVFASPEELPDDLVWKDGMDEPEIGDPGARRGGVLRRSISAFPPTLRVLGPESNNSFRGYHYDEVEMGLVAIHPETGKLIPACARRWAVSEDHRTVWFEIDPEARYSDGTPVTSDDAFMSFYLSLSGHASDPFRLNYYSTRFTNITRYDARTFSVTLVEPKPKTPYFAACGLAPVKFYREFGPDFPARYQWRPRPTAGAYAVLPKDIRRGRSVTLSRVKNWWAKDRKYYRHRFNPDKIVYRVVRSSEKAFQLFRNSLLDAFSLNIPSYWNEKMNIPEFHNGWIHKVVFHNEYPRVPRGLYLNVSQPLLRDRNIRVGICHAANFRKLIDFDLRGEFSRLRTFSDGFGEFSHPTLKARKFSVAKARAAFREAGFDRPDADGILRDAKGRRLSVSVNYPNDPFYSMVMLRLAEEGGKAGIEFRLEGVDPVQSYQKVMEKKHEICLSGWGLTPPYPHYYQFFHSYNAWEGAGKGRKLKKNTNNINAYANPRMDRLTERLRAAETEAGIRRLSHEIEELVHREAIYIPGFTQEYYRVGFWRWVRFPEGSFNVKRSHDPFEAHVLWLNPEKKAETERAMREGDSFPAVERRHGR